MITILDFIHNISIIVYIFEITTWIYATVSKVHVALLDRKLIWDIYRFDHNVYYGEVSTLTVIPLVTD